MKNTNAQNTEVTKSKVTGHLVAEPEELILLLLAPFKPFLYMRNLFHSVWFVCGGGGAGDRVRVETLSPPCSQQWQQEAMQSDSRASKIDSIILDMWLVSKLGPNCFLLKI